MALTVSTVLGRYGMTVETEDIIRQDVAVALANVTVGLMLTGAVGVDTGRWWIGVLVAVLTIGFVAAADRSRLGLWVLLSTAGLVLLLFVWGWSTGMVDSAVLPVVLIGIGSGACLNRILFGLVRPVPAVRKRREQSS
jgi:hypothetical protein